MGVNMRRSAIGALVLSVMVGLASAATSAAPRRQARGRAAAPADPCATKANQLELTQCAGRDTKCASPARNGVGLFNGSPDGWRDGTFYDWPPPHHH